MITVGEVRSAIAIAGSADLSGIDWNEVRQFLISQGLYTPEVAAIIDQYASGNFSALYAAISFFQPILPLYPDSTLLSDAIDDYTSNNFTDYADALPASEPPSEMDWGATASEALSDLFHFDSDTGKWILDGIDEFSDWASDQIKELAIAEVTGGFMEHAEAFLDNLGERLGVPRLYQQVQEAKELYDELTNFHTNVFDAISDVLDGKISLDEFDQRINSAVGNFQQDLLNVDDSVEAALESAKSGIVDFFTSDAESNFNLFAAAPANSSVQGFHFAFGNAETFAGSDGKDGLIGGSQSDWLRGLAGNDILVGLGGADALEGGRGDDVLFGGEGEDIFTFAPGHGADVIYDFSSGDKIDLSALSAFKGISDVLTASTNGSLGTTIDLGGGGSVRLDGILREQLSDGDFLFGQFDEYANSIRDASLPIGKLNPNAFIDSAIEVGNDRDMFSITLQKGVTYRFDLLGEDSGGGWTLDDPYLWLHDSKGKVIAQDNDISSSNWDAQIIYTAKKAGVFYLQAAGYLSDETGSYRVQATAIAPEIQVYGNGVLIGDDDLLPSAFDGTAFGNVSQGSTLVHKFSVTNEGTYTLTISKLKAPKGFVLVEPLSQSIAPGQTDNFQVRVDSNKVGVKSGSITFKTNDADEGSFNFALSATVAGPIRVAEAAGLGSAASPDDFQAGHVLDAPEIGLSGVVDVNLW
jgi:hypothetical protein